MKNASIALLVAALALQVSADTHLLPAGEFKGRDGRPGKDLTWKLPDAQGRALAARLNERHARVKFNLDYEHQAMLAETNGQPAPASGWANLFEWRDGIGLFALATAWTARAKQMIDSGEYLYISPVIVYDKVTGLVTDVLNAALVNIPNLDLNPVAQERMARLNANFSHQPTEFVPMNPLLKALLSALGLPAVEATTEEQAMTAFAALKARADQVATLTTEVAMLKSKTTSEPDPTKWVSLDAFNALNNQVVALNTVRTASEVDALLAQAKLDGKLTPNAEPIWRKVGMADLAQLKALVETAPANPALAGQLQSGGRQQQLSNSADITVASLSKDQRAMCKQMGIAPEDFVATLKREAEKSNERRLDGQSA
jgi:phage I-like protein